MCLDLREFDKNISTSKHLMRRQDDIIPDMGSAKYFTVSDTKMVIGMCSLMISLKSGANTASNVLLLVSHVLAMYSNRG